MVLFKIGRQGPRANAIKEDTEPPKNAPPLWRKFAGRGSHACSVPVGPLAWPLGACAAPNGCPDAEDVVPRRLPLLKRGRRKWRQVVDFGLGPKGFLWAIRNQERKSGHRGGGRGAEPSTVLQAGGVTGRGATPITGPRSLRDWSRSMGGWTRSLGMGSWSRPGRLARPCLTVSSLVLALPEQPRCL